MGTLFNYLYQFLESASFLLMCAIGMAIIYGMMNVTNMATGQMIMLGAYTTVLLVNQAHVPLMIAILAACAVVAVVGLILDRLILCRLYDRPMEALVATWGVSLILAQAVYLLFGPTLEGVAVPFGAVNIGGYSYSVYRFVLIGVAMLAIGGLYILLNHTRFGLHARATMQNREIASAMGVNANRMNITTFMLGSALAGLVGGLYAPTMSITPSMGNNFLTQAFVPVIVGGSNPLIGTLMASTGLGAVEAVFTILYGTFTGRMAILLAAILCVRFMPDGFTSVYLGLKNRKAMKKAKAQKAASTPAGPSPVGKGGTTA